MAQMEDVVKFFNSFLDIYYAGTLAVYSESDAVLDERRAASMEFVHAVPGVIMSPLFGRERGLPADELAEFAEEMDVTRRPLFLVAEYRHPSWGALYGGYIGDDSSATAGSYGGLLYATEIDRELKIIAIYREDFDKASPPVRWRHSQGAEIGDPGKPVAVRPLEAPTERAAHRQDWESLGSRSSEGASLG